MDTLCYNCSNPAHFLLEKDGYKLVKCEVCYLVFVHPQPQSSFLREKVYSFESGYQANKRTDLSGLEEDSKTKKILDFFENHYAKGRILDIGCSNGEFLYLAKKRGFDTYGVELNKRTADIARANGLNVFNGRLEEANYDEGFFDALYLGDVIEHVESPKQFVRQCKRLLKKGGVIIISTPNLDCPWSKITFLYYKWFGIPWSSVTPPHHLFQFSEHNLTDLMKKESFRKIDVWYMKPPRLMYELGSLHLVKRWKKSKKIKDLLFVIFSFGAYTLTYLFCKLLTLFIKKDFSMIAAYNND